MSNSEPWDGQYNKLYPMNSIWLVLANFDTKCASFDIKTFGHVLESSSAANSIKRSYSVSLPKCASSGLKFASFYKDNAPPDIKISDPLMIMFDQS